MEAFGWDSDMVKEARKEFFLKHSYNFVMEGTHDLLEIFRQMATSAKLLGTFIYKIQASWMGHDELKQVNYALMSLPKGLKFLHAVPPSESPKVIGLVGIYDPDALCHFSGITHCPWCEKEGKNEGTMVNHLWTVHYRLGLVCNKCHDWPSITSNTLHHHGQQDCWQPGEKNQFSFIWVITRRNKTISARYPNREVRMEWPPLGCPVMDSPTHQCSPGGGPAKRCHPPTHTSLYLFSHKTQLGSHLLPLKYIRWGSKLTTKTVNNIKS